MDTALDIGISGGSRASLSEVETTGSPFDTSGAVLE